jgi:hypothetical protein
MTRMIFRTVVVVALIVVALVTALQTPYPGATPAGATSAGRDGTETLVRFDDDDDDDDDQDNNGRGNSGNDNPGNSGKKDKDKQKDDPADHDQGQGNDDKAKEPPGLVTQLPEFRVRVECAVEDGTARTACIFLGINASQPGDDAVTQLAVPHDVVCGVVTGGSFLDGDDGKPAQLSQSMSDDVPAYVGDDDALLLLIDAQVMIAGESTYWVMADDQRVYPATGPGLACAESAGSVLTTPEPTPTPAPTGSIVVRSFLCEPGISAGEEIDWYTVCDEPAAETAFSVESTTLGTGGEPMTGQADENGELAFNGLDPATYHLERTDGNWCHAESDSVNENGDVMVEAGDDATIWVFSCQ